MPRSMMTTVELTTQARPSGDQPVVVRAVIMGTERVGRKALIVAGLSVMAIGLLVLGVVPASTPLWALSVLMILVGLDGPLVSIGAEKTPPRLRALLEEALSPRPTDRPSAEELIAKLVDDHAGSGPAGNSRRQGLNSQTRHTVPPRVAVRPLWRRRMRKRLGLATLGVAAVVGSSPDRGQRGASTSRHIRFRHGGDSHRHPAVQTGPMGRLV